MSSRYVSETVTLVCHILLVETTEVINRLTSNYLDFRSNPQCKVLVTVLAETPGGLTSFGGLGHRCEDVHGKY